MAEQAAAAGAAAAGPGPAAGAASTDAILASVVIPAYNAERYLPACLESVLGQTHRALEVVVVNDGSTDGTLALVREWAAADARIRVLDQPNAGVSAARNAGLDACTGAWVCFVDADDWLEPDAIERMLDAATGAEGAGAKTGTAAASSPVDADGAPAPGAPIDILIADYFVDAGGTSTATSFFSLPAHDFATDERIELVKNCYLQTSFCNPRSRTMVGVPWARLYRVDFLREHALRFEEGLRMMEDAAFTSRAFWVAAHVAYRPIAVYHYRLNSGSATHSSDAGYEAAAAAALDALGRFIAEHGLEAELMGVYYARKFMFAFDTVRFVYILDETGMGLGAKVCGVRQIMEGLDLAEHEQEFYPYLRPAHRIAFALYKLRAWGLMYFAMTVYFKYRMRRV